MPDAMNLEPKAQAFVEALAAANLPLFEAGTPEEGRALVKALRPPTAPREIAHVSDHAAPGPAGDIPVRLYRDSDTPVAAILYLHGGGWVLGGIEDGDAFARELAATSACEIWSVAYRLAPEARYPAAVDDAQAALVWLAARTDLPIVLLGDSAGGNLATVIAARARDAGGPTVALQVLAYPVTDAGMDTESYATFAAGPLLTAPLMAWFWDHYAPDPAMRAHPDASPLRAASLAGLPPALVLVAENDPLRDEGEAYARAMQAAGVPVTLKRYDGQIHSFLTMVGAFDGGAEALADIAAAIRALRTAA